MSAAVESYLTEKEGIARSHEAMRASWKALKPMVGHLRPDQIDRFLCRQYADMRRRQGRSDGTIIKDLGFLRTALFSSGNYVNNVVFVHPESTWTPW